MSSAAQVLRQAETLKASVSDSSKGISETWVARQRLEDLYKKLLLMDLEYALDKKVEQDLWNHAFKNHINNLQTQTKDKQNPKRGETQATLSLFLETASGFYLQLLQLVCTTFKLDLPFRRKSSCVGIIKEKVPLKVKITPPKKSSCLYICQHCLVHLGDIARYRQQIDQAQTYYWHAANLLPFNGQPYNQLAIVEAANGNKLSTVFYYIRSLAVRHPFPVAATNLEKLYNKISKDMCEFKGKLSVSEMITAFLQFQAYIHMCVELKRADMLSEKLLAALPAHVTSQSFPSGILVQIVAINIFAMQHATRQTSDSVDGSDNIRNWEDLTADEESSFQLMFNFTISVLDVLLQYTPKQEQKLRDFFTLPAVKLLLDWFKLNPEHLSNPTLKTSTLWTNLCKVLNNIRPAKDSKVDVTKYEELPLTEDVDLRCFQPLEKAHSGYSFSRVPSEGLPLEVESQLRCQRLVCHGKWIAEEHPSLNLLNIQTNKTGKLQFTAPSVTKLLAGVDTNITSPERNSKRQNVAIQAIIQKQSQNAKAEQTEKPSISKSSEKIKTVMVSESSTKSSHTSSGTNASPKYLLGVPTSEPLFMKSGSSRQSSNSQPGIVRTVAEKPPRLQKQHQLQQQQQSESGNLATSQQQLPWQQQKQKQGSPKQQQKVLWQQSSQDNKEATPQLLTKQQLSPQPTQLLTKQQQQLLSPQPQLLTKQQLSPQSQAVSKQQVSPQTQQLMTKQQQTPPQSGVSQPLMAQQPSQNKHPPLQQQQFAPPVNQQQQTPQNQSGQTTKPFMILQSEYRSSPRMSVPNQQQTARDPNMMFSQRPLKSSQEGPQNHLHGKMNTPFRPQMANDAMPGSSFDMMPPNVSLGQNQGQMHGQNQSPMHMQGQKQNPGQIHNQGHHDLSIESMDAKQQQLRSQSVRGVNSNIPFPGNFPPGAGPQFGGKANSMPPTPSQSQQGGPGPMGPTQFPRNGPPSNMFFGNKGNLPPFPGNQMNFPPAPGSDRMQVGGFKQPAQGGPPPQQTQTLNRPPQISQQQSNNSPGFQGPIFNPLALLSNISRFGIGNPNLGSMDQAGLEQLRQGMRKEDLQASPADILGALTLLAVQPPRSIQENTTTTNRLLASFQGHAEGTPKPETGISPSRSPLIQPPEQDTRPIANPTVINPNPQQQGTYSLFSSSPWSVPLSTSDNKSMGSSPFSSESNSIRNSPDPATTEINENKHGHGLDLGLRFGAGDDWRDKGHAVPHPDTQPHQGGGPGPFFSSTFQSIWSSSQGQSPLERLLEKQQKQRQNDPH